jgi:hypothetical protein
MNSMEHVGIFVLFIVGCLFFTFGRDDDRTSGFLMMIFSALALFYIR